MDGLTILGAAFFFTLGFLVGWVAEWRMDVAYWSAHIAELSRRRTAHDRRARPPQN